jgi:hypothetical protein
MTRKFIVMSVAPLLAVAAVVVMPAMASAATREYGTCAKGAPATVPPCAAKDKFTPFKELRAIPVLNKNVALTGKFTLQIEKEPANGIECEKLSGQGILINLGGVGHSESTLVFEKCKGTGALAFCNAGKINGTEKLIGLVSDEVNAAGEDEVTVQGGFTMTCEVGPGASVDLGAMTGGFTGQEVPGKGYETNFNKAKGEVFAGELGTLTGTMESAEAFAPKARTYVDNTA